MAISGLSFSTLVNTMVTAAQSAATALLDVSVGSIALALFQACAGVALWLQGLVLQLLLVTRASTSVGSDLDSWMADFGVVRLAATFSDGALTFSRLNPSQQAVIPVGTIGSVGVGGVQVAVALDLTNTAYSAALGGYVLPVGVSNVTIAAAAVLAGSAGNVTAGSVNSILSPIPGIDSVTNAAAFAGGFDPESDAALRSRFQLFIQSLSKATKFAVGYAVTSLRQGLAYKLVENQNLDGTSHPGFFYVVVDDGTGAPATSLLTAASTAIEAVRACGVTFSVFAPTIVTASVSMTTTSASGANHSNDVAAVTAALNAALNALPLGAALPYTQLASIAYGASPTITNVQSVLLNGATADLTVTAVQVIKTGTVSVA